jgi:hypothetical protein
MEEQLKAIRKAVADYIQTEGCSCCQDIDGHAKACEAVGKLLSVPMYGDGSGYDFNQFATTPI